MYYILVYIPFLFLVSINLCNFGEILCLDFKVFLVYDYFKTGFLMFIILFESMIKNWNIKFYAIHKDINNHFLQFKKNIIILFKFSFLLFILKNIIDFLKITTFIILFIYQNKNFYLRFRMIVYYKLWMLNLWLLNLTICEYLKVFFIRNT